MKVNNQTTDDKQTLTPGQKQKMKKYAVFALMFIIFGACLWLIFSPSADEKAKVEATQGFNTDIPMPTEAGIIDNKKSAYEEDQLRQRQEEKMRSLQDFAILLDKPANDLSLTDNELKITATQPRYGSSPPQSSVQTSAAAYHDINRTLGTFYESPKEDPERERLAKELEEIRAKLAEDENSKNAIDEQLDIMEKSYQIAAKYMPQIQGQTSQQPAEGQTGNASGRTAIVTVTQVTQRTVSALQQDISNADMVKKSGQARNLGFFTATVSSQQETKNTIAACVHDNQTVMDGQSVRLRLQEQMQAGTIIIPRNTVITGTARIQGERLQVIINSLEFAGAILPVELTVYDTDGQRGIFIPNTAEINAIKEIVANMGTSAGTSISLTSDAGQQLAADLGRSVVQGTSQYVSKKLREIKVNLKTGYRVFLLPDAN